MAAQSRKKRHHCRRTASPRGSGNRGKHSGAEYPAPRMYHLVDRELRRRQHAPAVDAFSAFFDALIIARALGLRHRRSGRSLCDGTDRCSLVPGLFRAASALNHDHVARNAFAVLDDVVTVQAEVPRLVLAIQRSGIASHAIAVRGNLLERWSTPDEHADEQIRPEACVIARAMEPEGRTFVNAAGVA